MNYSLTFVKKPAMKWLMVFDLPASLSRIKRGQRQIEYYTLRVLCASSEAGGEYKLQYLCSKAGIFSLAEGLMD